MIVPRRLPHLALVAFAVVVTCLAGAATAALAATSIGAYTTKNAFSFVATPKLHPPKITIKRHAPTSKLAPGYLMLASFPDVTQNKLMAGQSGPLIMDNQGQPVWFKPVPTNVVANNLTTQTYNGKPALSWWQGVVNNQGAILSGEDVVVDQRYKTVATLGAVDGWVPALHEFVVSGHDAWAIVSKNIPTDFTAEGGPAHGVLIDTAVAEFDLTTHKLVQLWNPARTFRSRTHLAGRTRPTAWDAYHTNSVKLVAGNKLLVGMRNTWAAYLIDLPSGKIEWKLGGKRLAGTTNFTIPTNAQFQWQHDVELHSGNVATIFDDHCCAITGPGTFALPTGPSRALQLRLNMTNHTASLVSQIARGARSTPRSSAAISCWRRGTCSLAGGRGHISRSTTARASCCLTARGRARTSATAPTASAGPGHRASRRTVPSARRTATRRCMRAGTEPRRSSPGGCWPARMGAI